MQLREETSHDLLLRPVPLLLRFQRQEHETVRHVARPAETKPDGREESLPLRQREHPLFHLAHVPVRIVQRRTFRRDHDAESDTAVLHRHQLAREEGEENDTESDDPDRRPEHGEPVAQTRTRRSRHRHHSASRRTHRRNVTPSRSLYRGADAGYGTRASA